MDYFINYIIYKYLSIGSKTAKILTNIKKKL